MVFDIMPDGSIVALDGSLRELGPSFGGTETTTRASHVYRDDALRLPWQAKPVLAARSSEEGQWVVRLSFSPINGQRAGYRLPERFTSRREAIQAEIRYIEKEVL